MDTFCPACRMPIPSDVYFCPNCGKKIKDPCLAGRQAPPSVSISRQIVVYSVSLFIPPFGLWYAYKYLKHGGETEKKVAYAAIVLTVISVAFTAWTAQILISAVNQALNGLNLGGGLLGN